MRSFTVLAMLATLGVVLAATVLGLGALWPSGEPVARLASSTTLLRTARVTDVEPAACRTPVGDSCLSVEARVTSGPRSGATARFVVGDSRGDVVLDDGDRIYVYEAPLPPGTRIGGVETPTYAFADFQRRSPLLVLIVVFAALVLLLSRFQGLRSLVGLALSLALVIWFVVPAILEGSSPTGVALVGALTIMFVTIPLAHGIGPKALAACLGTTFSLTLTVLLAEGFSRAAHLTGLTSDEALLVLTSGNDLSLRGLVVAGMVIAALGVLDDLTVSQASTVMALRTASPALGAGELYRRGLGVGRDHVAATVNTLVLAYAGASLPVLLVFALSERSFGQALDTEVVAEALVSTLVGSIGLVLAVPVTTGLAALLAVRLRPDELGTRHAHAH